MSAIEGTRLSDRYELREVIGRGGMGVVHRAWDSRLQRQVAVKVLNDRVTDPVGRARFRAEGTTLARLSHPGLITLHDAAVDVDEPYLVMELIEGRPLNELTRGPSDPGLVISLGADLAEALDHVHRHRIVHRDVKPSNVLVDHDGRVKLADFGVARLLDNLTHETATGMTVGTAAYLSPEQVRGEVVTPASDIYSLGLVLIETLSGTPAFDGSREVVALARLTAPPRIGDDVPGPLREFLVEMTAPDPARRPTAAEVGSELRRLSAVPLRAESPRSPAPAPPLPAPPLPNAPLPDAPLPDAPTDGLPARPEPTEPEVRRRVPGRLWLPLAAAALLVTGFLAQPVASAWLGGNGSNPGEISSGPPSPAPGSATSSTSIGDPARSDPNNGTARSRPSGQPAGRAPTAGPRHAGTRAASPPAGDPSTTGTPTKQAAGTAQPEVQSKAEAKEAKEAAKAQAKADREARKDARKKGGNS